MQREVARLTEEKSRELALVHQELGQERDKWLRERDSVCRLEKVSKILNKILRNLTSSKFM